MPRYGLGIVSRIVCNNPESESRASEVLALRSDPSLAARLLNLRAEVKLEEGLVRAAVGIRENHERFRRRPMLSNRKYAEGAK